MTKQAAHEAGWAIVYAENEAARALGMIEDLPYDTSKIEQLILGAIDKLQDAAVLSEEIYSQAQSEEPSS